MFILNSFIDLICNSFFLTGYVTNSNTFPLPLDEAEEQMYLKKFKEGDKTAKSILIERNLRLVAHIVKKYSFPNKDVHATFLKLKHIIISSTAMEEKSVYIK